MSQTYPFLPSLPLAFQSFPERNVPSRSVPDRYLFSQDKILEPRRKAYLVAPSRRHRRAMAPAVHLHGIRKKFVRLLVLATWPQHQKGNVFARTWDNELGSTNYRGYKEWFPQLLVICCVITRGFVSVKFAMVVWDTHRGHSSR